MALWGMCRHLYYTQNVLCASPQRYPRDTAHSTHGPKGLGIHRGETTVGNNV